MSWIMIVGVTIFASLVAMLMLTEWIVWRGRPGKGLQWCDNSPRQPTRIIAQGRRLSRQGAVRDAQ